MNNPQPTPFGPPQTPPKRVISLVPCITESLFDLALGDRVVGITNYCIHPADQLANLPRLGGTKNPKLAEIIALEPDLVIMNRDENRLEDAESLVAAGINVWATHPRTVQDVINLLWQIMEVFDQPSMVERVRSIERLKDWTIAATAQQAPPRVFAPIWYQPWMTVSSTTYIHDLLRVCGGTNIFGESSEDAASYPEVTEAQIIAGQPEVILLPDEPYVFGEKHVTQLAELDVPAAHNNRIHQIDGTLLTWFGTRVAQALTALPPLLLPATTPEKRE